MYQVVDKEELSAGVFRFVVEAPDIARKARAGQFVILRLDEHGERIPLTISDALTEQGSVVLFVQTVGKTSTQMSRLSIGDSILDLAGPLGNPSEIALFGTVVLVGGGFGVAAIYPIARDLTQCGNTTISILGARTQELLLLEEKMKCVSTEVLSVTDEGSEFSLSVDAVVIALGSGVNPLIAKSADDLKTDTKGHIELADPDVNVTYKPGVFAGGDIVTGAATVISAMGAGKKAAIGIHDFLMRP
jgi:Pyridine nucleotide-disulphide oxidoreductase/Oxidoreductase FAD-binding domain